MKKKIALLQGEVTGKFQEVIMRAVQERANELGYDLIAFCAYGSYNEDVLFGEGEKASSYIIDYSQFDGIIVGEDLFDIAGMADEIYEVIKETATCPVVYMRTRREGFFSILTENYESIKMMTNHFIKDHGFTDICYMSGKKGLLDATERLNGFLDSMSEAGLSVAENDVFYGDYWREKGKAAVNFFMKNRTKYPQAIICANDYMALSICEELSNRGIRVPEDVCVSGFDYVEEARLYQPSITSFEVDFAKMGVEAVNIIDDVHMGVHRDEVTWMLPQIRLHSSCGCGEQLVFDKLAEMREENYYQLFTMKNTMLSNAEYQDAFDEEDYFGVAERYFSIFRGDKIYICVCDSDEEGYMDIENESRFTNRMILKRIFTKGNEAEKLSIVFNRETLLPVEYLRSDGFDNFFVFSLHFKNQVFGYVVAEFPENNWFDIYSQAYLQNLASAMKNAAVQGEIASLEQIKALYQKDTLTGLYNRRGFEKFAREKYEEAQNTDGYLTFVSLDMDGLKYINDTFGHTEGDRAINSIADAIRLTLLEGEVAARVGGDEFVIILCNNIENRDQKFISDFTSIIKDKNEKNSLYPIGASFGMCNLRENPNLSVSALVQKADFAMYENKRSKAINRV